MAKKSGCMEEWCASLFKLAVEIDNNSPKPVPEGSPTSIVRAISQAKKNGSPKRTSKRWMWPWRGELEEDIAMHFVSTQPPADNPISGSPLHSAAVGTARLTDRRVLAVLPQYQRLWSPGLGAGLGAAAAGLLP